jgi:hypothetical protein
MLLNSKIGERKIKEEKKSENPQNFLVCSVLIWMRVTTAILQNIVGQPPHTDKI